MIASAPCGRCPAGDELPRRAPGLRVPGAFDGFELAVRAILGQRMSVQGGDDDWRAAWLDRLGEPIETPVPDLNRLCPSPARLADVEESELRSLGISGPRAATHPRDCSGCRSAARSTSSQAPIPRP